MPHFLDLPFDHVPNSTGIISSDYVVPMDLFCHVTALGKNGAGTIKINSSTIVTPYGGRPFRAHLKPGDTITDIENTSVIISTYRIIK